MKSLNLPNILKTWNYLDKIWSKDYDKKKMPVLKSKENFYIATTLSLISYKARILNYVMATVITKTSQNELEPAETTQKQSTIFS